MVCGSICGFRAICIAISTFGSLGPIGSWDLRIQAFAGRSEPVEDPVQFEGVLSGTYAVELEVLDATGNAVQSIKRQRSNGLTTICFQSGK